MPAKADVTKQRKFYDEVLQPLMKEAKAGTSVLLFLDASHFVMGCDFLGYIYGKVRRFITTFSGRGSVIKLLNITKPIPIDEKTNNNLMDCFTLRKTDCFTSKPFYSSSQCQMITFYLLCVSLAGY